MYNYYRVCLCTLVTGSPTNVTAEMINASTIRVSWNQPRSTATVYIICYTGKDGEKRNETIILFEYTALLYLDCGSTNIITIEAISSPFSSAPVTIEFILRKFSPTHLT